MSERAPGRGAATLIVIVYAVLALAATGRSSVQLATAYQRAPLAYVLSALAAVVYLVATVALARRGATAHRIALLACTIELIGVVAVGTLSYAVPALFPDKTVWSHFGQGYGFVPLVLPFIGLWWLSSRPATTA